MAQELFSSGPWHLDSLSGYPKIQSHRTYIMDDAPYSPFVPRNPADWHLIASAPDLYELVLAMVGECPNATLASRAYRVLAEARGER